MPLIRLGTRSSCRPGTPASRPRPWAPAFSRLPVGRRFPGGKTHTTPHPTGETAERAQARAPPAVAKKPSKYQQRRSQYVFYSDFPLEMSDPLFRELEELPEQLQNELRLPMCEMGEAQVAELRETMAGLGLL